MSGTSGVLYDMRWARDPAQLAQMEDLEQRGICIFCLEHFGDEHREPVEFEGEYWYVSKNDYPYKDTRVHLLLLSRAHVVGIDELPPEAGAELFSIINTLARRYGIEGGGMVMRFGNTAFTGGTIRHLHAHLIVPELDDEGKAIPVYFPIG